MVAALDRLLETGLYGISREAVAERMLCRGLEQTVQSSLSVRRRE